MGPHFDTRGLPEQCIFDWFVSPVSKPPRTPHVKLRLNLIPSPTGNLFDNSLNILRQLEYYYRSTFISILFITSYGWEPFKVPLCTAEEDCRAAQRLLAPLVGTSPYVVR